MATCGEALVRLLEAYGVDTVFGIPGVHTVELYRGLPATRIRHVTPRHEQGAGFMADGYARVSGKPGVCFIITGPGMTNILTAMGQAYGDSIPMLVISSVNRTEQLGMGQGRLHELPSQQAVVAGVAAFSHTLLHPGQLPEVLARAFALFAAGGVVDGVHVDGLRRPVGQPVEGQDDRALLDVLGSAVERDLAQEVGGTGLGSWDTRKVSPSLPVGGPSGDRVERQPSVLGLRRVCDRDGDVDPAVLVRDARGAGRLGRQVDVVRVERRDGRARALGARSSRPRGRGEAAALRDDDLPWPARATLRSTPSATRPL